MPEAGAGLATLLPSGKVLVVAGRAAVYDSRSNAWTSVGSPTAALGTPTATLLSGGKVLLVGNGRAEVFDPSTSAWTPAARAATARGGHTATLLPDGGVLVVGGETALDGPIPINGSNCAVVATAEIYDPLADTWTTIAGMTIARAFHTATPLPDGRVLVAGGVASCGDMVGTNTAELFDPKDRTWSAAAPPTLGRVSHTATLLPDGTVLMVGGTLAVPTAERYDPKANVWVDAGGLRFARNDHTATLLPSGKVLVVGGVPDFAIPLLPVAVEIYDPLSNLWSISSGLPPRTARWAHTATVLPDGNVLFAGGLHDTSLSIFGTATAGTALYDPLADQWTARWQSGLTQVRYGSPTATLLDSGRVLVVGGRGPDSRSPASTSVEIYDPATKVSTSAASTAFAHDGHLATRLQSGKVLVIDSNGAEVYDAAANTWTTTRPLAGLGTPSSVTNLPDGRVFVLGAQLSGGTVVQATPASQLYDPSSDKWSAAAPWLGAAPAVVLLPSGKVLAIGGYTGTRFVFPPGTTTILSIADAGVYDLASDTWQPVAKLPSPRAKAMATILPNNQVLLVGGTGNGPPLLYDVATNNWNWQRSTVTSKFDSSAQQLVNLPSGQVLMFNGLPDTPSDRATSTSLASEYLYDPQTNNWSLAARSAFRSLDTSVSPTSTVLASGQVLRTYGSDVEHYDPQAAPPSNAIVPVIEYYNAQLDHYFVSSLADDIYGLDAVSPGGWMRTGETFNAYDVDVPGSGASPVCRFYIPPGQGDSHFFSASTTECAEVQVKFPSLIRESPNVMFVGLPDTTTGACPAGWKSIYRVWNNRADSNHRYTSNRATRDQMVAKGWIAEGYGSDALAMCSPP